MDASALSFIVGRQLLEYLAWYTLSIPTILARAAEERAADSGTSPFSKITLVSSDSCPEWSAAQTHTLIRGFPRRLSAQPCLRPSDPFFVCWHNCSRLDSILPVLNVEKKMDRWLWVNNYLWVLYFPALFVVVVVVLVVCGSGGATTLIWSLIQQAQWIRLGIQ